MIRIIFSHHQTIYTGLPKSKVKDQQNASVPPFAPKRVRKISSLFSCSRAGTDTWSIRSLARASFTRVQTRWSLCSRCNPVSLPHDSSDQNKVASLFWHQLVSKSYQTNLSEATVSLFFLWLPVLCKVLSIFISQL